jgi:hypothetical protein
LALTPGGWQIVGPYWLYLAALAVLAGPYMLRSGLYWPVHAPFWSVIVCIWSVYRPHMLRTGCRRLNRVFWLQRNEVKSGVQPCLAVVD